jgi:hypothetical protein
MEKNVIFKAVIEVVGKPAEHVEASLKKYIEMLKNDKVFEVAECKFADTKKQEDTEMWSNFAELEVRATKIEDLTHFAFQYMPSMVEIVQPKNITFSDGQLTNFLNDLQSKLHQVDMVAKTMTMENEIIKLNSGKLLKNYIILLLSKENMTAEKLGGLTGVNKDKLADFLDKLIDEGKIDMKEGIYYIPQAK